MPILASLGTANDRAFGFGDSSFASGYDLPAIITNNAEIIYDASNPNSVRNNVDFYLEYQPSLEALIWTDGTVKLYHIIPAQYNVQVGDKIGKEDGTNPIFYVNVLGVTRNVTETMNQFGNPVSVTGDKVVIDAYSSSWSNISHLYYKPQATKLYDISGNDRHATLGGTPALTGYNNNQYFVFTDTNNAQVPSAIETPVGGGNADFVYYFVANLTGSDPIFSTQWHADIFLGAGKIVFEAKNGSGSSSITDTDNYNHVGWRLFKVTVSASYTDIGFTFSDSKSVRTDLGGQTGFATSFLSNNTGGNRTFSSFTAQDGAAIKFVSLYATANDPGLTNVYNALKGRFGL
jgi:hypothetical protein